MEIVILSGETDATVYVAATCTCRACGRVFGALSRRVKPADVLGDDAVCAAFLRLLGDLGCSGVRPSERTTRPSPGQPVWCSYCASAGGKRDMRAWELRTVPDHLPPARGGWLAWDGEEAEDDDVA